MAASKNGAFAHPQRSTGKEDTGIDWMRMSTESLTSNLLQSWHSREGRRRTSVDCVIRPHSSTVLQLRKWKAKALAKEKSKRNVIGWKKKQALFWKGEDVLVFSGKINNSSINNRNLIQSHGIIPQWGYNGHMKAGGRGVQAHKRRQERLEGGGWGWWIQPEDMQYMEPKRNAKWMTWQLTLAGTVTPSFTSTFGPCVWSPTVSDSKCDHLQLHFTSQQYNIWIIIPQTG